MGHVNPSRMQRIVEREGIAGLADPLLCRGAGTDILREFMMGVAPPVIVFPLGPDRLRPLPSSRRSQPSPFISPHWGKSRSAGQRRCTSEVIRLQYNGFFQIVKLGVQTVWACPAGRTSRPNAARVPRHVLYITLGLLTTAAERV